MVTMVEVLGTCLDVGAVLRLAGLLLLLLQHLKLEPKVVNWDGVLASIVLQHTFTQGGGDKERRRKRRKGRGRRG